MTSQKGTKQGPPPPLTKVATSSSSNINASAIRGDRVRGAGSKRVPSDKVRTSQLISSSSKNSHNNAAI